MQFGPKYLDFKGTSQLTAIIFPNTCFDIVNPSLSAPARVVDLEWDFPVAIKVDIGQFEDISNFIC